MDNKLLGSALQIDITPPIGTPMEGYAARIQPSIGIHDPLLAGLILLKQGVDQVLLISLEQLAISAPVTEKICTTIMKNLQIKREQIMVACTHTHGGPSGYLTRFPMLSDSSDPWLVEILARKLAGAAVQLSAQLEPVFMELGRDRVFGLGQNRNDIYDETQDHELLILVMKSLEGRPKAVWVNYGCHPTILGHENRLISADFPGAARRAIASHYPELVWLFMNGASGDISTRFTRRGQNFAEVERAGLLLACAVLKAMQTAEPLIVDKLSGKIARIKLPLRDFGSVDAARTEAANLDLIYKAMFERGESAGELRKALTRAEGAQAQVIMAELFAGKQNLNSSIQIIRIGSFLLAGLPGEVFTETVLSLKALRTESALAVAGYTNDYCGYFPDQKAVKAKTYEALDSLFSARGAEMLINYVTKLIEEP
ncbi:MAG TPA: neutral/alkaline non-lysosomal ceramidase N-terminal domain-containing protein [Anaerolineaceae bacterium]|nr:neutral/alkaline non-lysosomal ceramidase N-terminal domain-containing protein [Anaerolineaceae bacterium]